MNINLWIVAVLLLLVVREIVTGSALFVRRTSVLRGGLDSYHPELFVYREEAPLAFWIIIAFHSFAVACLLWRFW